MLALQSITTRMRGGRSVAQFGNASTAVAHQLRNGSACAPVHLIGNLGDDDGFAVPPQLLEMHLARISTEPRPAPTRPRALRPMISRAVGKIGSGPSRSAFPC